MSSRHGAPQPSAARAPLLRLPLHVPRLTLFATDSSSKSSAGAAASRAQRRTCTDLEKQSLLAHATSWRPGATVKGVEEVVQKSVGWREGRSKAPRALGGGSVYGTAYVPTCRRWTDGPLTAQELDEVTGPGRLLRVRLAGEGRLGEGPSSCALKHPSIIPPPFLHWAARCCGSFALCLPSCPCANTCQVGFAHGLHHSKSTNGNLAMDWWPGMQVRTRLLDSCAVPPS